MKVHGLIVIHVSDPDHSTRKTVPASEQHGAVGGGLNRGSRLGCIIHSIMGAIDLSYGMESAVTEARAYSRGVFEGGFEELSSE
jgi:hypothetical protein